ncbi:N-acetyltransferase [Agrobacterium tumefaciens]|nr:N-acetyltransferase [Agrobacterium tumefaciens]KWT78367.1 hypothetical protein ASH09_25920 [Agrobacterium radiobacter]NIB13530.1 N-acetyltransferase [Agrobacterium radiobacter]
MPQHVFENAALKRFELVIDEEASALAYFRMEDGVVILFHTEVPYEHSGQGYASSLAEGIFSIIRTRGQKVWPTCEFMARYVSKHPELNDLLGR